MSKSLTSAETLALYPPHNQTLWSILKSRVEVAPDRPFVVFNEQVFSYRDFINYAIKATAVFHSRGVRSGDRIGVMSRNHISTIVIWFALSRLGAIMCPINPSFKKEETKYIVNHAGLSGLICSPDVVDIINEVIIGLDRVPWIMINERVSNSHGSLCDELDSVDESMALYNDNKNSTCVIIYTSGTTGSPKGVMHSQRSVILAAEGFVERMHLQPHDRLLCILPLFHINALFYSVFGSLAAGATVILERGFSATSFWKTVAEKGATEVNFVAAIPAILARRPREEFVPEHTLEKICVAPLTAENYRTLHKDFNVPILLDGYGMTEIPGVAITPFDGPQKLGSVGKLCKHPDDHLIFSELRVVNEKGVDVPTGIIGELIVRTPTLMQGYFRDPDQTEASFRDGWFITGDLGYIDDDDYIWFIGRKKDIIRKRGENISGMELDRVISNHPKVVDAAVIAVPAELGEDEILAVVLPEAESNLTELEIAEWCGQHLSEIKIPRYVVFVNELPRTPTLRIAKHRLNINNELLVRAIDITKI